MDERTTAEDVRDFFAALTHARWPELEERLAEDVVLDFPGRRFGGRVEGRRRVLVFLKQNQRLFEGGLRFEVSWAGIVGDRAVAEWRNAGSTRAGQAYENRGCTVFRLAGGRVVEIHDYLDTARIEETWPA
jgi:ketosteroid isomerase-like protein